MHENAKKFLEKVKLLFPNHFYNKKVIDIGAGDINGNNRYLFTNCEYIGVDVVSAPNVDLVCKAKDIPESFGKFDTVISSECFEHDFDIYYSLQRIIKLCNPNGLFLFTCATLGRPEHGTAKSFSTESYSLKLDYNLEWYPNYYKNLTMNDFFEMIDFQKYFTIIHFEISTKPDDIYFYGIRNEIPYSPKINQMDTIFSKYNTDKKSSEHNYTRNYETLLHPYIHKNVRLLEIGVANGGSLQGWREYFRNSSVIVGVDINEKCKGFQSINDNIYVEIGDGTNKLFMESINEKFGPFDIIIDDGSHLNKDVINSFELLFPLLNNNGLYLVEDTCVFKNPNFVKSEYPNHIEYFSKYLPLINQWNLMDGDKKSNSVDPWKIIKTTDNVFEYSIGNILFSNSFICIKKEVKYHWINNKC
jgi:SAM-dependent methyltransferase